MTELPVRIAKGDEWLNIKIDAQKDAISIPKPFNKEIPYKSIVDLEERKNVLTITLKGKDPVIYKMASVEKVLQILKKMIVMSCSAYRLSAYFMSPAIRGGVFVTDAKWEKGAVAVLKTGIWFVSQDKQVCVPLKEVTKIELTKKDLQKKPADVIKIDHMEASEVVTSYVLCPISTLQTLLNFLKDATKDMDMAGEELDTMSAQVAMLVYSAMDTHAIEKMIEISPQDLDAIFEKLIKMGLVEVVLVRKEVQLTPKGVRYITEATNTT